MSSNVQKTPLARSLEEFAQRKVRGALTLLGQSLPASVVSVESSGIVMVKFELTAIPYTLPNITVPMIGSEYIRLPIQPGCPGWVMTADAYLGGMSGLGGGTADLTQRGNLSALIWSPIGNKNWEPTEDQNKLVLYGPDGAIFPNAAKTASVEVTDTSVTVRFGAISIVVTAGGIVFNGPVTFENTVTGPAGVVDFGASTIKTTGPILGGEVTGGGIVLSTHHHGGVQTGGGNTGPPDP